MSSIKIYKFPKKDDYKAVEQRYCELLIKYREGVKLHSEELDWMDAANNWLIEAKTDFIYS